MKLAYKIYSCVIATLTALVSILLSFIELRMVFAGDYLIMNNPGLEIASGLFRAFYFLMLLFVSVLVFIRALKAMRINFVLFFASYVLLVGAFASYSYYNYLIYFIVSFLCGLLCSSTSLGFFLTKEKKEEIKPQPIVEKPVEEKEIAD